MVKSTRWKYYQPNKKDLKDEYGDCVIRALTKALDKGWLEVFDGLIPYAREIQCHPNTKQCYTKYLEDNGFIWESIKVVKGKKKPTPQTFYKEHPSGIYVLRLAHHIVTVEDGYFYDTWDSGDCSVYGYWKKVGDQ